MFRPALLAISCLTLAVAPVHAQPRSDPDWPCIQRKVATLGAGAIWTGPDIASAGAWGEDREAARVARVLASRRTELKDVDGLLDEFLQSVEPAERAKRLTRVFAGVFEIVNDERTKIINGIVRYAQGQNRLAERIREEADKISESRSGPPHETTPAASKEAADLETQFNWDKRIFEERSQSVTYVCEVPTLLEQRLGEIARKIQAKLPPASQ